MSFSQRKPVSPGRYPSIRTELWCSRARAATDRVEHELGRLGTGAVPVHMNCIKVSGALSNLLVCERKQLMQQRRSLPSLGTGSPTGKRGALAGPPVLLSGRAAERLARVQHLGAAPDSAGLHSAQLAAVVLQHPVAAPVPGAADSSGAAASWKTHSWARDTDSELAVTARTLHRLRLFHGSFVQARCSSFPASTS